MAPASSSWWSYLSRILLALLLLLLVVQISKPTLPETKLEVTLPRRFLSSKADFSAPPGPLHRTAGILVGQLILLLIATAVVVIRTTQHRISEQKAPNNEYLML